MPPAFASTQKKEKKTVRLTCGVRAGRTARSESSARTPANARARNWNLERELLSAGIPLGDTQQK